MNEKNEFHQNRPNLESLWGNWMQTFNDAFRGELEAFEEKG